MASSAAAATATDTSARRAAISQSGELRSARVESLRALAALGVVLGHLWGQGRNAEVAAGAIPQAAPHGGPGVFALTGGVFLFFALSGYLLFWPFAQRHFGQRKDVDLGRYATNRVLRILPLYYVALVVVLVLQEDGGSLKQWLLFSLFLQNYSHDTVGTVDGPMWSLCVEIIFYAVLPFAAAALARVSGGSRMRAALVLVAVAVGTYVLRRAKVEQFVVQPDQFWQFSPLTTFGFFVPGMLVALLRTAWEERRPARLSGLAASADAWFVVAAGLWLLYSSSQRMEFASGLSSFFLIAACVLPLRDGRLVRLLDWRPLALVGVASYSLYLWHDPLISAVVRIDGVPTHFTGLVLLCVPLCLAAAAISYAVIERPFLRLRRRWA